MAAQTAKSGLASKLGNAGKQAFEKNKNNEVEMGKGGDAPSGIESGIAQLTDCKFGIYKDGVDNAGEYFFYAAGVVVSPKAIRTKEGDTILVEGLRTSIIEPMCATPNSLGKKKTVDDHIAWVINELKKLGADLSNVSLDNLESVASGIKEASPTFRFRTWSGEASDEYPVPRTNHQWNGATDFEIPVEDDVTEEEESRGVVSTVAAKGKVAPKATAKKRLNAEAADSGDEDAQTAISEASIALGLDPNEYPDWTSLYEAIQASASAPSEAEEVGEEESIGTKADAGDAKAIAAITKRCRAAEFDENEYATWADVEAAMDAIVEEEVEAEVEEEVEYEDVPELEGLGLLADGGDVDAVATLTTACEVSGIDPNEYATWEDVEALLTTGDEAEAEEEISSDPQLEEIYLWTVPGTKKPVECEVVAVDAKAKTVTLKDTTTKKLYKAITWATILA